MMEAVTNEKVIEGFIHRIGVHCTSSALRNLFEFNGIKLSEAMVFGLGSGMGLGYLKFPRQDPMIGGRNKEIEKQLGKILDIPFNEYRTKDQKEGWIKLKGYLENNQPQAINIDMFYLPYFEKPFHFGQHTIVVCGYNPKNETVQIADTNHREIKEISVEDLTKGRNSTYNKWMDPYNFIYEYDFTNRKIDLKKVIPEAIRSNGKELPKTSKMMSLMGIHGGTKGILKFSKDLAKWVELSDNEINEKCERIHGYISEYGTGGGFFRFLYSTFLKECSEILEDDTLVDLSNFYNDLGNNWEKISDEFLEIPASRNRKEKLVQIQRLIDDVVKKEEMGSKRLSSYYYNTEKR
jgi:hypothetical protein